MKKSTHYAEEARRCALKGLAILSVTVAACVWLIAIFPIFAGIPLALFALLASVWPIVEAWAEAGELYKKADREWLKEKGFIR